MYFLWSPSRLCVMSDAAEAVHAASSEFAAARADSSG